MPTFPGAYPGQMVTLLFESEQFETPDSVLVLAFFEGRLLFTRNRKRGWELPGGKIEPGEFPIAAAIREVYEETGAELDALEPIAQYRAETDGEQPMVKTVYTARIRRMLERPEGFETEAVRLYAEAPGPELVRTDRSFSPLLGDEVYAYVLELARKHPFSRKKMNKR